MFNLEQAIVQLYKITATQLPSDVLGALEKANEIEEGNARIAIEKILENCKIAKEKSLPICQDTGVPIFYVFYPKTFSQKEIIDTITAATATATKEFLRPNALSPIPDENAESPEINFPEINFFEWNKDFLYIDLLLKGGGSENASFQYSIPCEITSERSLSGVKKIVLHHISKLQGNACPPGILGLCIGGTRVESLKQAQRQLFRKINDSNDDKKIAEFEKELLEDANSLGIGPMGFGGKTTLLGVKASVLHRHPATFFVSIAYSCWACRRHSLKFSKGVVEFD